MAVLCFSILVPSLCLKQGESFPSRKGSQGIWDLWSPATPKGSDRSGHLSFHVALMYQNPQWTASVPFFPGTAEHSVVEKAWTRKLLHGHLCSDRHSYHLATWSNVEVCFVEQMLYCGLLCSKQTPREG